MRSGKRNMHSGFWLDFRRVLSRRTSGNKMSVAMELLLQPFVVACLVFLAFLNREKVEPFRLNFLYFSTLYAFWVGLFGSCQALNSEVRNGEWCYWVLGMGRNRMTHVLAVGTSGLLFAFVQCFVFLFAVVVLSSLSARTSLPFNHFTDMFVSTPDGDASPDPINQMNGVLWFVLAAKWGSLGPLSFATGLFGLSLFAALVSGTVFGLLFSAFFKEPAISLNIAVGFVVLLGMMSYCGLRGDGSEKIGPLFAPIRDGDIVRENTDEQPKRARFASAISYVLPQRYFFNIGQLTFSNEWSDNETVQDKLRDRVRVAIARRQTTMSTPVPNADSEPPLVFNAIWTTKKDRANFDSTRGTAKWIKDWGYDTPVSIPPVEERSLFTDYSQPTTAEMIDFLRRHRNHRKGWMVSANRDILRRTIFCELIPLVFIDFMCLLGTLVAVWRKRCYQELR